MFAWSKVDVKSLCTPEKDEVDAMTDPISIVPMKTQEEMDGKAYVHWKSWQETYTDLMPQPYLEKVSLDKCMDWAHRWPQNTLVLKMGGQVIGFSCFGETEYTPSARAGEIMALYLLRDFQGRGLGFQLMKAAMEELNKMPQIILWVLEGNERAIHFYESLGFRFDGARRSEAYGTELRMIWKR